jgi:hypothetical protein
MFEPPAVDRTGAPCVPLPLAQASARVVLMSRTPTTLNEAW